MLRFVCCGYLGVVIALLRGWFRRLLVGLDLLVWFSFCFGVWHVV